MKKPSGSRITGELTDLRSAIRSVPRYAHLLMSAVTRANKALDKLIDASRPIRWLPYRVISTQDLNELTIAVGKTKVFAEALAEVGYFMVTNDHSLHNPWEDENDGTV